MLGAAGDLSKPGDDGLVAFDVQAGEVGRPRRIWRLTEKGHGRFPDTHAGLTASLIDSIRSVFGEGGLDRLIAARQDAMGSSYRRVLAECAGLAERVAALARLWTAEGYMAECKAQRGGGFLLIENHCPICAAAKPVRASGQSSSCFRLRSAQTARFTRQEHLLRDGQRCVYLIAPGAEPPIS